jgi:dihydrolipoamide dehydrogenase
MDVAKMIARKDGRREAEQRRHPLPVQEEQGQLLPRPRQLRGKAVEGGYEITVAGAANDRCVAKQVIMATGSNARALPGVAFDEEKVLSNDGALRIGAVPAKLGVIGSGVIGLEMGSVWRRLGAEVTVLEAMPAFLMAADEGVAKEALKVFTKQGLKFEFGVKIAGVKTRRVTAWW